jgi:cyclopropane fatty-acyl-phospholipid synthase-like methyltransferase
MTHIPIEAPPTMDRDEDSYHKYFHDQEIKMGIGFHNLNFFKFCGQSMEALVRLLRPQSLIELGSGQGTYLSALNILGVDAIGIDINPYSQAHFREFNPEWADRYILSRFSDYTLEKDYDVAMSIEVFEHIDDSELDGMMNQLSKRVKYFFFSSTPERTPQDQEWGHINIKSEPEWIEWFCKYGFIPHVKPMTPTPWTIIFKRGE